MRFLRKNTLFLSMLIGTSLCSSNAMEGDIGQPKETSASIIESQNLEYCISLYTDLIAKDKKLAELKGSLEEAKTNFETTKERLEIFPENINVKGLYRDNLKKFSDAKSHYMDYYDALIMKFKEICDKEGLAQLYPQLIEKDMALKEEARSLTPVASKTIAEIFKKAWALVDSYKMDTSVSENKEEAKKLFKQLIGLHPYAPQGLTHCKTDKEEVEAALSESIKWKLDVREEAGLLGDLELLCAHQNARDVSLLLQAAQYYKSQFDKNKNPVMIYNVMYIGTMMPKCQEGNLFLNQIASLNILSKGASQNLPYWAQERQSMIVKDICYRFMNLCRNQENIEYLDLFLTNNNFEGDWCSAKDEPFFAQQLERTKNDKKLWSHKANLNVLGKIRDSSSYPEETRVLAAKIRFDSTEKKSFDTYFDYYKILKQFDHVERHKYIGILHKLADCTIQSHPEHLYKVATELGYSPDTLSIFMEAADAGCKEAMLAVETHNVFFYAHGITPTVKQVTDYWFLKQMFPLNTAKRCVQSHCRINIFSTDEYLENLALFFARHNSVEGLRSLHKRYNKDALLVIIRGLEERPQPLKTLNAEDYLPLLDLEYEERKANVKKLEGHISELEETIRLINSAQPSCFYSGRVDVTHFYRPTIAEAAQTKNKIQDELCTSKTDLEKNKDWLKAYDFKRKELIEGLSVENLFNLAKDNLLIYQALNSRLRYGQEGTKILKDTYFDLLKKAAQHSQDANNELKNIEANGFSSPLYVLPSEELRLEKLEEFRELDKFIKEHLMDQLHSNKPLCISFNEKLGDS